MVSRKVIIALTIGFVLIVLVSVVIYNQRPLTQEQAAKHLEAYFKSKSPKEGTQPTEKNGFSGIQVMIQSEEIGLNQQIAYGYSELATDHRLGKNQPFHVASIGKLFTAVMIYQAVEQQRITLDDPLTDFLDEHTVAGLFTYQGTDYAHEVTVRQLLAHTSGVADYFGDPSYVDVTVDEKVSMPSLQEAFLTDRNHFYNADELILFSKEHQLAVGKPGEVYHYSDTGYVLLGRVLETIYEKPFEQLLAEQIFNPLGMKDSYMAMRTMPQNESAAPIADIWFHNKQVNSYKSLTVDWSGGGVISTPEDLVRFARAIFKEGLISDLHRQEMFAGVNVFEQGIYTGEGGMEIHFEDFFPLLKGYSRVKGHIGILSTHLFYDDQSDTVIVLNYGSDAQMVNSFKGLIEIMTTLKRIKTE